MSEDCPRMWYLVRGTEDLLKNFTGYKVRWGGSGLTDIENHNCAINNTMETVTCMSLRSIPYMQDKWRMDDWVIYKRWCRILRVEVL